jgi:hypothetical protein
MNGSYYDYLCEMILKRRITALFFATLVTLISVAYPVIPSNELTEIQDGTQTVLLKESSAQAVFIFQENLNAAVAPGWKVAVDTHSLLFINDKFTLGHPAFRGLKKIIVLSPAAYAPCKSLFLFPFHDFL